MDTEFYVQYGCGPYCAPEGWINFDASPTLRLQRLPGIGRVMAKRMHVAFAPGIRYGDIRKGLPGIAPESCKGIYCSHVLEHLSYEDCRMALYNTFGLLMPGGTFRCVVPDLEKATRNYLAGLEREDAGANSTFLLETRLGRTTRPKGVRGLVQTTFGNSEHLFMWDHLSLAHLLEDTGFRKVRRARFNDSDDPMFRRVEDGGRFQDAVALEATR